MKILFKCLVIGAAAISMQASLKAQTTFTARNTVENFKKVGTTTNATATLLDSILVANTEGGLIEIKAVAYLQDSASTYIARKQFRYAKKLGTLTVTVIDSSQSVSTDLSGAGIYASATAGNNLKLTMVGKASTTLKWTVIPKQYFRKTD